MLPQCDAQCTCLKFGDKPAELTCAHIECPEDFDHRDFKCVSQYANLKDCCRSGEICGWF